MVWYFIWPATHPKYVHPPGTAINFFHLQVFSGFWPKFFKTPCVPNECIYRSNFFVREHQVLEVSFDAIFGQRIFQKFLHLNPKGKVALRSCLGPIFKRKKNFLGRNRTSSKHHRRCLEVQRTCLKPFPTSEPKWGLLRLQKQVDTKIGFFWAEISDGCAYVCKYFLVGCAGRRGPKGSYLRGKSYPTSLRYLVLKIIHFK